MSEEISVPFHGATIVVPKGAAVEAWLDKVLQRASKVDSRAPRIGERWPGQGGFNGGVARDADGNQYWLIVSPSDVGAFSDVQWGGRGLDASEAQSEFDGRMNTKALLALNNTFPAASQCAAVTCEGHTDYYLPAKRELAVLFANVRELFEGWHWSSTQYSAYYAWSQDFSDGTQDGANESYTGRARAVRRLDF